MERFAPIVLVAGLLFFLFGTFWQAVAPWLSLRHLPYKSIDEIAQTVPPTFRMMADDYPDEFKKYFGEPDTAAFARALRIGRGVYVAEACWHCHTQQVRPVSNEELRFGPVSYPSEYANALQLPPLLGTRRVGPDLIREAGVHSSDWHMAHFKNPPAVTPGSVMPSYGWFFDKDGSPGERALAVTAYIQWLGSWIPNHAYELPTRPAAQPEKQ